VWQWTDTGFATREIVNMSASGQVWKNRYVGSDWQMPDGSEPTTAKLDAISATVQDDDGFTSEHICVVTDISYPDPGLRLRLTVWAYPNASGIRTQLSASRIADTPAPESNRLQGLPSAARVERVPIGDTPLRRRFFGYYNETQQRNDTHQDLLKEEVVNHPLLGAEWCDWASVACVEDSVGGIALVKESHKCVNQRGHATGGFICDQEKGLSCTGWGLRPNELSSRTFTAGWATWCLVWSGGEFEREVAFKTFDRIRYPIDPARDIYIQANTWGSTDNAGDARRAGCEESALEELEVCADLGIDVLQIDDGWQVPPGHHTWEPEENGWHPHPESYPNGWSILRSRAKELGLRLGLWAAAVPISIDELRKNFAEGGFVQYKLDFAVLRSRAEVDALMEKVRDFIGGTDHRVRVNWDVTENAARYGYFFAREYGCIFLENRKPVRPASVVYRPHTVLRDLWQLAKYLNLHRFQGSIQNVDRVDPDRSDAMLHSHSYAVAIALMGIPLFFQETKYYSDAAKAEIRGLLSVYKKHRESIYSGIVHPIGAKPNNASWTGFHCHLPSENRGYLMIFRERCNEEPEQSLRLRGVPYSMIAVTDLLQEKASRKRVASNGALSFHIDSAPGFLFLEYVGITDSGEHGAEGDS
tara:strand:+ start:690 stop:2621 length:1932 start_codon:yes stop_codon:yes gene_type:complete